MFENKDEKWMSYALNLAQKGQWHTDTNPMVGALLVKNDIIIGKGWHEKYGGAHAEVNAFKNCKESVENATLYVTLEPCCHYGKTPPCVELILKKKIKRVVIATTDPNPIVSGKSIKILKEHGINVKVGILEKDAIKLNEIFNKFIIQEKPFVLYKAAMSIDGKTACYTGDSQWISSEQSRNDVHFMRNIYKAIMVGAGTVTKDNPSLTSRYKILNKNTNEYEFAKNQRNPIRIIVDGKLSSPINSKVFNDKGKTIILTTSLSSKSKADKLKKLGNEIIYSDLNNNGTVDLNKALKILAKKGINGILLEGGAETAAQAFEQKIIDKIKIYAAPIIIGGKNAPSIIGGNGAKSILKAEKIKDLKTYSCGVDIVIEGYIDF